MNTRCLKGARCVGDTLYGPGFVLLGETGDGAHFRFLAPSEPFSFVFAFRGVGCHFQLDFCSRQGFAAFHEVRDGQRLYLHHVCSPVVSTAEFSFTVDCFRIEAFCGGFRILSIYHESPISGAFGFVPPRKGFAFPRMQWEPISPSLASRVVVLGDGFSNARWEGRHFLSWPELAFGHLPEVWNAAVAAGNSTRVLEIATRLADVLRGSSVIVAVGSDDHIESRTPEFFLGNCQKLLEILRTSSSSRTVFATLPPRDFDEDPSSWNSALAEWCRHNSCEVLDFYSALRTVEPRETLGYPGPLSQNTMAEAAARHFGLPEPVIRNPPAAQEPGAKRVVRRILHRLNHCADRMLGCYPHPGISARSL
jgi:hypothetical protein